MTSSTRARATTRRIRIRRIRAAGMLAAIAASAAALVHQSLASSSSAHAPPVDVVRSASPSQASSRPTWQGTSSGSPHRRGALGEADGAVPDGTTVFDDDVPAVVKLDPRLLAALRRAATAAAADGIVFVVDSGWRSPAYQERLLQDAVSKYGSEEEASRWVAKPTTSAHVSGDAVDVGHAASEWLSEHGAEYGLCRIYGNESWHYELRPEAIRRGCPPTYADPTHDPTMWQ